MAIPNSSLCVHQVSSVLIFVILQDNFQGGAGVRQIMLNSDKARIKSAAKRRLKSGRRAHFTLGTNSLSYKTVSGDTFAGKPLDDEHIPAAGKVCNMFDNLFPVAVTLLIS